MALRFLRYCDGQLEEALKAWREFALWRAQFRPDELSVEHARALLQLNVLMLTDVCDGAGRPVIYLRWCNFEPRTADALSVLRGVAYIFERLLRVRPPLFSVRVVSDYENWSLRQMAPFLAKQCLDTVRRYPFVPHTVCVNVPWYFRIMWRIVRPFMSAKALEHFTVCGSGSAAELDALFAPGSAASRAAADSAAPGIWPRQLAQRRGARLKCCGGTDDFDVYAWIEAESAAERAALAPGTAPRAADSTPAACHFDMAFNTHAEQYRRSCADLLAQPEAVVLHGELEKRGGGGYFGTSSWKRRYFILTRTGMLYYFDSRRAPTPQRVFDLRACTVDSDAAVVEGRSHGFVLHAYGRPIALAAATDALRTKWLSELQSAIASFSQGSEPSRP